MKLYIVRDKNGTLKAFKNKPVKRGWNFWDAIDDYPVKLRDTWFPEVKWEDKEPKVLTIEESPWIKVEDRLPAAYQRVLCCCEGRFNTKFYIVTYIDNNNEWDYQYLDKFDVIAWMPIPELKE